MFPPTMSHVHGAYRDFSSHNILTQLLSHYDSWNKNPTAVFIPAHTNRLYRNSTGISTVPASRQTGLPSKLPFIKVSVTKLGSCLGISPYCLLLPVRTQTQEGTPTETAGVTFPTDQAEAQLHFGPKSNLWCFTWNADPAVHWVWSLLKLSRPLVWRSPVPGEEAASTAEGTRLLLSPEAAWKCSKDCRGGNTLSQVFWRRGNKPFKGHKSTSTYSQTAWCRDVWKPGQPSSSLSCLMMLGKMMRVWEEVWVPK